MSQAHLWDFEHPYYWNEGCFFARGHHFAYKTWEAFLSDRDGADEDLNLLCRWDWDLDKDEDDVPLGGGVGTLKLGYVVQRKGFTQSCAVKVSEADEPAVRAWLERKAAHIRRLWDPLLP